MKVVKFLFMMLFAIILNASEKTPSQEEVAKLYVATFNRAPDSAGLKWWTNSSNLKLSEIAQSFFDQEETKTLYPTSTSNSDFIASVYSNLFNRTPDTDGLNYWEAELNANRVSKNSFIQAVINGAQNTSTSNDADILSNKTTVGLSFSEAGKTDLNDAKTIMASVTSDSSSVTSAVTQFGISLYKSVEDKPSDTTPSSIDSVKLDNIVSTKFASIINKAGVSAAIYKTNAVDWKYATGKATENSSMTVETPSVLYSVTKTITSAQILKLAESGTLSLTDTISQALNGHVDLLTVDTEKINLNATVSDLLTHRSGIQGVNYASAPTFIIPYIIGQTWKPVDNLGLISENYTATGIYKYSDANYILLGMIAEHKGSQNLNVLIENDLFTPIGITGNLFPRELKLSNLADPYDDMSTQGGSSEFGNLVTAQEYFFQGMGYTTWSAAGMSMTAANLAKWGYELYSANGKTLSSSMRENLLNSTQEADGGLYGYGMFKTEITLSDGTTVTTYGHGGGGSGYQTQLYYVAELDISIAVLKNSNNSTNNPNIDNLDINEMITDLILTYKGFN